MSKKGLLYYIVLEGLLLCLIEIGKCVGWSSLTERILMFTAILINTIIVAHRFYHTGTHRIDNPDKFVAYALFATAAADFFMTLIGNGTAFLPGAILFCFVQILYAMYLCPARKLPLIWIALFTVCLVLLKMAGMLNMANTAGMLDLILLLVNTIIAWTIARKKTTLLFRVGITLFLLCDLFVALRHLTAGLTNEMVDFFVWIFYIPSQAAITLSYLNSNPKK